MAGLAQVQAQLLAERALLLKERGMEAPVASRKRPHEASERGRKGEAEPTRKSTRTGSFSGSVGGGLGGGEGGGSGGGAGASPGLALPVPPAVERAPPAANSSRGLPSRVPWLNERLLGRFIPLRLGGGGAQAKKAVMRAMHAGQGIPTFNKYAGVAEFSDSVVLFVNLFNPDKQGGPTRNRFQRDGRSINWYGGDRAHENTPSLLRLRYHLTGFHLDAAGKPVAGPPAPAAAQRGSASASASASAAAAAAAPVFTPPCPVALVLRLDASLPYVYAGELEFEAFLNPGHAPVEYLWTLKHYTELTSEALAAARAAAKPLSAASRLPLPDEALAEDQREAARGDDVGIRKGKTRWLAVLKAGGVEPTAAIVEKALKGGGEGGAGGSGSGKPRASSAGEAAGGEEAGEGEEEEEEEDEEE